MMSLTDAMRDVCLERQRQKSGEGFDDAHDDAYKGGELPAAAMAYCMAAHVSAKINPTIEQYQASPIVAWWPWDKSWWKPKNPRRDLVRSAALIIAEIERLDRSATGGHNG